MAYKIILHEVLAKEFKLEVKELLKKIKEKEIKALVADPYIFIRDEIYILHKSAAKKS